MAEGRPVRSLHGPITRDARFVVACDQCDFQADSAAATAEEAAADLARRHKHHGRRDPVLTPTRTDYKAHPLFVGRFEHEDARRERESQPREVTR